MMVTAAFWALGHCPHKLHSVNPQGDFGLPTVGGNNEQKIGRTARVRLLVLWLDMPTEGGDNFDEVWPRYAVVVFWMCFRPTG